MQPSSVDFPAPFGPIKQVREPGATRTVTSSTACDGAEGLADAARFARGVGHACVRHSVDTLLDDPPQPLVNAVPNSGVGLHEAILPAHMLGSWIPLWFVGEK